MSKTESDSYTFQGQRPGEEVFLVANQHTWVLLPAVIVWLLLLSALGVVIWYFGASAVTSVAIAVVVIIGVLHTLYCLYIWKNGVFIVTSHRVIKIDQLGLFSRLISEAEIHRIQEISTEIAGPIRTMLNFGTVKIQTASTTGRVDLDNVPDPYNIQQEIVKIQRQMSPTHSVQQGL